MASLQTRPGPFEFFKAGKWIAIRAWVGLKYGREDASGPGPDGIVIYLILMSGVAGFY